jgi:hypothetical protein
MIIFLVDEPALTLRQDCQCGCVNYLKRVSVMSEMSVWGRARGLANLAYTYHVLRNYTEAEKLEIQVLDARNRILGVEHQDTINAMENLAAIYRCLAKYTEADKLKTQAYELKNRVSGAESSHTITLTNVQEAQEIQALDAGSTVPAEENLHSTQVVLNNPVQAVLLGTTMNPEKKGMHFAKCFLNSF